jgi:putative DNA primase/helicase
MDRPRRNERSRKRALVNSGCPPYRSAVSSHNSQIYFRYCTAFAVRPRISLGRLRCHAPSVKRDPGATVSFTTPWLHGGGDIPGNMPETSPTDLGNARRLVIAAGNDIRFCHSTKKWLIWTDKRWVKDQSGEIFRLAKKSVRAILTEAAIVGNDNQCRALVAHEQKSEAQPRIKAMVTLTESEPGIPVQLDELDRDGMLFNVLNGTIDLRTGSLREHRREDLITKLAPVNYDPDATCPQWDKFLAEILPGDLVMFVQRAVGYSFTGSIRENVFFLLHGVGANGKSTLLEVLRFLLGDYAATADFGTFLAAKGQPIRNDIARLHGARFVTAVESEAGKRMAENVVKALTGGDTIAARFLYSEHFEFIPAFKLWLATNHKPRVIGTSEAVWRRIQLISFDVTIPKEKRDRDLTEKLKLEAAGILNWALAGLHDWQARGLCEPEFLNAATSEYRKSQEMLTHFLESKCAIAPGLDVRASELYRAYKEWAEANGEFRLREHDFSSAVAEHGFVKRRVGPRVGKPDGVYWTGIGIRPV